MNMIKIFTDFFKWFAKLWEPVFEFLNENRNSPFLWIGLFLIGLLIFKFTYDALNRGHER